MFEEIEDRLRCARPSAAAPAGALETALAALPAARAPRARRRRLVAALVAAAVAATGVVTVAIVRDGDNSSVLAVGAGGGGRFPSDTFTDWVSYADQVSIVTVVGERALAPDPPGSVLREVTLRVDDTLWRRQDAPKAGEQEPVITYGWSVRDGDRRPVSAWGGPRLEVGARYVMPLVRAPRDGVDWTPLSLDATLPLEGDRITTEGILGAPGSIARRMTGSTPDELAAILDRTRPDPLAAKRFDLPPDARWEAVVRDRG